MFCNIYCSLRQQLLLKCVEVWNIVSMAPDLSYEVVCFCGHPKNDVVCRGCWFKIWDRRWWLFNNSGNNKKPDAVIHIQDPKSDGTAADTVIVEDIDYDRF